MFVSNHVCLRSIEEEDLEQLREWRNNVDLRSFFREHTEISRENQRVWYEQEVLSKTKSLMFAIVESESKKLLGACGLCYIDWLRKSADLSIYIGHKGIYLNEQAVESAKILIKYAFDELGMHRLWSEVYSHDLEKQSFFKKLGFVIDGRLRESHWTQGKWVDSIIFGLLSTDR